MSDGAKSLWLDAWLSAWGFDSLPTLITLILALGSVFVFVILPSAYLMSLLDRRFSARLQARLGPNRAGPRGLLQPLSDFIKLLQKEPSTPLAAQERLWFGVHTFALFSTVAVLPLGSTALLVDSEMSVFLPFWSLLVLALGSMLVGLGRPSVPGWFGGVRVAAQTISGMIPALLCVLTAGVRAGGYSWTKLASSQGALPLSWGFLAQPPFQVVAFLVFLASGLVVMSAQPFDAAVSRIDIQGGVSAHLSGRYLALFEFGRFYGFFFWSLISVVVFLGAWNLPPFLLEALQARGMDRALPFLELSTLMFKTWGVLLLVLWVSRTNPRIRVDQITELTWKVLGPLSLICLVGATLLAVGGGLV